MPAMHADASDPGQGEEGAARNAMVVGRESCFLVGGLGRPSGKKECSGESSFANALCDLRYATG